jgi:fermentation-respiration switch protein FrsA (DUF1100 family)
MVKIAVILAIAASAAYVTALGLIVTFQRSLLYHPSRSPRAPAEVGLAQAQVLTLQTSDGEHLVAWHVPAAPDKPVLLYFHGNAGGLADRAEVFDALAHDGYGVLAVSYRGFFGSTGAPTEAGLHRDALAAYDAALAVGYPASRIVGFGESLGTGVAVALAAERPLAALILEAPYTSTADVAADIYWMFPVRLMMWDQFRSDRAIRKVHVPLLVMHGENDGIVPIRFGQRLFELANAPKEFVRIPGAGHLFLLMPGIVGRIEQWLETHVPAGKPSEGRHAP